MGRRILWGAALALLVTTAAFATTLRRLVLADIVERSREIVVGTVRSTRCVAESGGRNLIFTDVEFEQLEPWKGTFPASTRTYRFAGGTLNGRTVVVPGVPRFAVGARYVLFADAAGDGLCATVGWGQGRYELRRDPRTGALVVHDADGRPVHGFAAGLPVLAPTPDRPRPLTVEELQVEVLRALEAAAARARQREEAAPETGETPAEQDSADHRGADAEKPEHPPVPAGGEEGR